jgi:cell division protein FtsB
MIKKIKQYQKMVISQFSKFGDIRFTGQLVFVAMILLISWSGARAIQTNYSLQEQIIQLHQQNELISLQNNNINLQNQYYNSNQYLELSARQNLGLAFPGEKELIVPQSVAMSYIVKLPTPTSTDQASTNKQPKYQYNIETWVDFFLHRNGFKAS